MPTKPRQRKQAPPSMLILHLDAGKLQKDGLHLGSVTDTVGQLARLAQAADVAHVEVRDITDMRSLLESLATLAEEHRTFDVVVAIGHSNEHGIQAASDRDAFLPWDVFANYLRPFKPRRLLLVACEAGTSRAKAALFSRLPLLRRIYACPVGVRKNLAQFLVTCAPILLAVKAPRPDAVRLMQVTAFALTGGQVRQWLRTMDHGDASTLMWDAASKLIDPALREVHRGILDALK